MAYGKNKRLSKKGNKKKVVDPFSKKDWYEIKAPTIFANRNVGKTVVTRSSGTRVCTDFLKGRVVACSLADLNKDEDQALRTIRLRVEDVQGKNCLTNFWGMDFTTDRLRSLVRKWQTLIEAHVDIKTTDGYILRLFCIGFTRWMPGQQKRTAYAKSSQIRQIRKKMVEIMTREAITCNLKDLVVKFIPNSVGRQIEKECHGIYPLNNVYIRKVKMVKSPKFDAFKLAELHEASAQKKVEGSTEETGAKIEP
eukprot:TRINITY_DN10843_c0_g1_i1.p1 TRINITY_DN10843_c0_g1~~TRINITY_DN10843_c0_g1_i1.p1  ORF type:complete len:252 (+),score=102.10 TRINITY_DN10843_c0_g1_i1:157-912(+)